MAPGTGSPPLQQLPNALTVLRFAAIPLFAWLLVGESEGPSWAAGIVFVLAAVTDQVDGYLARRWQAESQWGKVADPLADRLMIDTCVVLLVVYDRLPWIALLILARDVVLLVGYRFLAPRGYELNVSQLGKVATWGLFASLTFVLLTAQGTVWPLVLFWIALALALVAGVQYVVGAMRERPT